jgi:hypothetical protein
MNILKKITEKESQINNLQNQINNLQDIIDNGHEQFYNELSALGFQYDPASNEYLKKINERFSLYASREIDGRYRYRVTDSDHEDKNHIEYYDSEDDFTSSAYPTRGEDLFRDCSVCLSHDTDRFSV